MTTATAPAIFAVVFAGLAVNAASHWWIDRRHTLATLTRAAERAGINGKTVFAGLGAPRPGRGDNPVPVTGGYLLDQAWHRAWLLITTLVIAA